MNILSSKKLKYFIALMEVKNLNKAADILYITRSPLIHALSELEMHVGDKLFIRKYNQLEPTDLAISLYDRVKPAYDALSSVDYELNQGARKSGLELLFDISIPLFLFQYIVAKVKKMNYPVTCRRLSVSGNDIASLSTKSNTALFSFEKHAIPTNVISYVIREDDDIIILPESLSDEDILDENKMKGVSLYLKEDDFFDELKGRYAKIWCEAIPHLNIKKTDADKSSILFSISSGDGILIIPEYISDYFNVPNVRKIKIPKARIRRSLYYNKQIKNKALIDEIINILSFSSNTN